MCAIKTLSLNNPHDFEHQICPILLLNKENKLIRIVEESKPHIMNVPKWGIHTVGLKVSGVDVEHSLASLTVLKSISCGEFLDLLVLKSYI